MVKWHRHIGVYGICAREDRLLVIHKNGGPYTGRFDLPGGSIEMNESLFDAINREFLEETGIRIMVTRNIGTRDFILPWNRVGHDHTHCHHIAIFYEVEYVSGDAKDSPKIGDSVGADWMELDKLSIENSSPLVIEAVRWVKGRTWNVSTMVYKEWEIKNT